MYLYVPALLNRSTPPRTLAKAALDAFEPLGSDLASPAPGGLSAGGGDCGGRLAAPGGARCAALRPSLLHPLWRALRQVHGHALSLRRGRGGAHISTCDATRSATLRASACLPPQEYSSLGLSSLHAQPSDEAASTRHSTSEGVTAANASAGVEADAAVAAAATAGTNATAGAGTVAGVGDEPVDAAQARFDRVFGAVLRAQAAASERVEAGFKQDLLAEVLMRGRLLAASAGTKKETEDGISVRREFGHSVLRGRLQVRNGSPTMFALKAAALLPSACMLAACECQKWTRFCKAGVDAMPLELPDER
eukprot:6200703-Pleurochrysis_carterae.AAC.4